MENAQRIPYRLDLWLTVENEKSPLVEQAQKEVQQQPVYRDSGITFAISQQVTGIPKR